MFAFASPKGFEGHSSAAPMMAWQDSHGIAGLSSLVASPLATPRRPVGVDAVPATQEPSSTPANATSRMSFDSQGGGGKASSASRMSFDNYRDDGVSSPPFLSVPRSGGGGAGSRWSPYGFAEPAELGPGGASMSTRLKRPRSSSHLSDDDVQPTRLFGASPGTKRALSEMMAKDLQRLNVSPAAAAGAGERDLRVRERNSFDGGAAASASAWATTQPHAVTPRASWEGIDADASPWASSFGVVSPGAAAAADGRLTTWNDASPMSTEKDAFDDANDADAAPGSVVSVMSVDAFSPSPHSRLVLPESIARKRSALSQQLREASCLPEGLPPGTVGSSRGFFGGGGAESRDAAAAGAPAFLPPSPSGEVSPRSDLRKQAILKRVSLAAHAMPMMHATPRLMLPPAIGPPGREDDDDGDDENDVDENKRMIE